ncbi:L,D-transpeptidase family protein [Telluribacter sp.]|jgi:murein L,D-transpeptidase YcbB/YkuD|uniref:L,D-transpeptidase family protein n=1 Tax=Telluribacter sp. TaxID=1978767 RepID=UPI002E161946|nr:L,D-transpeptidase family protein [Telluribacter sp.]
MNVSKIVGLLLLVLVAWACENGKRTESEKEGLALSGGSEVAQDDFNYPKEGASRLIREWVDTREVKKDLPHISEKEVSQDLFTFYSNRNFKPAWNSSTAGKLLNQIESINKEGLNPDDYAHKELRSLADSISREGANAETGARLDLLLSATYLKLADMIATGKVKTGDLSGSWHMKPEKPDSLYTHLQQAVQGQVDASLDSFRPRFAQYEKLKNHLERYTKVQKEGGWLTIEKGGKLVLGDSSQRVVAIRKRLHSTGDLETPPDQWQKPALYDEPLVRAVNRFQNRNGLEVQPEITDKMVETMNVPVETRMKQVMLNMDRIRWFSSGEMPKTYVMVNVPEYMLRVYENGQEIKQMKVVVGKEMNSTPIFSDMIEHVEFSPYWNVPNSIAEKEIWPKIRANRSYASKNHYEILDGWEADAKVLSLGSVNWSKLNNYRIRQKPGPWNALGNVKFMFPNEYAIYLHDTPSGHLFDKAERAFSHGCIRIEDPAWFADWLFPQFNLEQVKQKMNDKEHEVVQLGEKVPVYIFYLTTFVDNEGRINFRDDLYELDKKLTSEFDSVL